MGDGVVSRSALLQLSERFAAEIQVSVSADVHVNCQAALEGVPDRAAGIPRRGRRRTILTATDAAPATEWPWLFSVNGLHGSIAVAGVDGSVSAGRVPIVAGVLPPIIAVPLLGFGADIRVTCCRISDRLLARRRRERRRRWKGSFLRWRICAFICWRVVTLYEGDVGAVRNHYLDIGYVRGRTYDRLRVEIPGTVHVPPPAIPAVAHGMMPAAMLPRGVAMINVALEIVRGQGAVRMSRALGSELSSRRWIEMSTLRQRMRRAGLRPRELRPLRRLPRRLFMLMLTRRLRECS